MRNIVYDDRLLRFWTISIIALIVGCCGLAWYTSPRRAVSSPAPDRLTCGASPAVQPIPANSARTPDQPWAVNQPRLGSVLAATDTHLFVGQAQRLTVLSLNDLLRPTPIAAQSLPTPVQRIVVQGHYVYVLAGKLLIFDIANPANILELGSIAVSGRLRDVAISGATAYVVSGEQVVADQADTPGVPQPIISLSVIDLSNPRSPRIVGQWETMDYASAGVAVVGHYAYIGGSEALYVLDVSDATRPNVVGGCKLERNDFVSHVEANSTTLVVSVAMYNGKGWDGDEVFLLDLNVPNQLSKRNSFYLGAVQDVVLVNQHLYVPQAFYRWTFNEVLGPNLPVIDLSNLQFEKYTGNVKLIGRITLPAPPTAIAVARNVAYVADDDGYVRFIDFIDPTHPRINWLPIPLLPAERSVIVFDNNASIFIVHPDGYGATTVVDRDYSTAMLPALSPDRTKIAFAFNTPTPDNDDRWNLHTLVNTGTETIRLTDWPARSTHPRWSPNGRRIVFQSTRDNASADDWDIWTINADGSDPRPLTNDPAIAVQPDWSPDGKQIVFTSYRDGNGEIYVMNADGSGQRRITDNPANDEEPAWSPDGRQIAFQSSRGAPNGVGMDVWVMNADGSQPRNLTQQRRRSSGAPAWSPDGTRIAFHSYLINDKRSLFTMNANGTEQRQMTVITGAGFPHWR